MNIDEFETKYLTDNQIEELSDIEKEFLLTRMIAKKENESK